MDGNYYSQKKWVFENAIRLEESYQSPVKGEKNGTYHYLQFRKDV